MLEISHGLSAIILFLFGLSFGSFGNVILSRLPKHESLFGRSHCPHCKTTLKATQIIPVISYFILRGKCKQCNKPISIVYPIVELLGGILFVASLSIQPHTFFVAFLFGLCFWLLLLIAIIDSRTQLIADALSIPLLVLAIIISVITGRFELLGFGVGMSFVGLQWLVSGGKWVGSGDVILMAAISLLLPGWQHVVLCLFLAYMLGASVAMPLLITGKKKRQDHLAFAPFLVTACTIAVFFGDSILKFYLSI